MRIIRHIIYFTVLLCNFSCSSKNESKSNKDGNLSENICTEKRLTNTSTTGDSLDKKISIHFVQYQAELYRYSGLTIYGESKASIEQNQIIEELGLFEELKQSDLIKNPTKNVFALCHNIIIHSPEKGRELFRLLNKPTDNENIISSLFVETFLLGEFGEQMALSNLKSSNTAWSKSWSSYLKKNAIYDFSIDTIQDFIFRTNDLDIKLNLISSLMYISNQ